MYVWIEGEILRSGIIVITRANNNNNHTPTGEREKNEYVQKSELRLYFWGVFSEKE